MTKKNAVYRATPAPPYNRAATSATAPAAAIIIGSSTMRNWAMPKSNSAWNTDRPISRPPKADARANLWKISEPCDGTRCRHSVGELRLAVQQDDAGGRQAGATDEHQVGGAPQGDVLAEEPVPDVVEREADERVACRRRR